jgi:ribonuclease HI
MAIGAVITTPTGDTLTLAEKLATRGCCNEAEARALITAANTALTLGATALHIVVDSTSLIDEITTSKRTKVQRLTHAYDHARLVLSRFERVRLQWLPRRHNAKADALAREALGLPEKPVPRFKKKRR